MKVKTSLLLLSLMTALNANAINCSKATTAIEKAICASESHLADDKKIGDLFNSAKKATQYPGNTIRAQQAWLAERDEICNSAQDLDKCIADRTQARIKDFAATEEPRKNLPFVRILGKIYSKGDEGTLDFSFSYLLFSPADTPQKVALNSLIEKNFDPGSNPLNKLPKDTGGADTCRQDSQDTSQSLVSVSSKYLALYSAEDSMGCGAAHPNHDGYNLHFDMTTGKLLTYPDVFTHKSLLPLIDICIKKIAVQRGDSEADYRTSYGDSVKDSFSTLAPWSFTENGAVIEFPPYAAASYSEGFITCEFTKAQILPYLTEAFVQILRAPKI